MAELETIGLLNDFIVEHRASCSAKQREDCPTELRFIAAVDRVSALARVVEAARKFIDGDPFYEFTVDGQNGHAIVVALAALDHPSPSVQHKEEPR